MSIHVLFFVFLFCFFLGVGVDDLQLFQEYFTYIEPIVHQRWARTEGKAI